MDGSHGLHNENLYDDDGIIQRHAQGDDYESYRVLADGAAGHSVIDDPYEFIYQNLPQRHTLRNVPDCHYCGAMRFQYEPPGFCCRKGKVQIHIPEVPVELKRRNGTFPNLDDYRIELNTNVTPDQRWYNAPTAAQVAAIWMEGNDPQRCFDRSVVVYGRTDCRPQYIRAYHGCYDPLAYPLYNPRGETGWNKFMPYSADPVTQPSVTPASTNVNYRDEGTTGAYQE
ncbi:unnamed protein product [Miscanthus lutarioriparius]|uniref:Uncharacterized protein n=1 Tax=Miscanthus lutarioriparius TaxID=422564 RepID=A0A811NLZ2_9POAL|nr:unnamed protein product [Miscanthus lutarioriparius]